MTNGSPASLTQPTGLARPHPHRPWPQGPATPHAGTSRDWTGHSDARIRVTCEWWHRLFNRSEDSVWPRPEGLGSPTRPPVSPLPGRSPAARAPRTGSGATAPCRGATPPAHVTRAWPRAPRLTGCRRHRRGLQNLRAGEKPQVHGRQADGGKTARGGACGRWGHRGDMAAELREGLSQGRTEPSPPAPWESAPKWAAWPSLRQWWAGKEPGDSLDLGPRGSSVR